MIKRFFQLIVFALVIFAMIGGAVIPDEHMHIYMFIVIPFGSIFLIYFLVTGKNLAQKLFED